MFEEKRYWFTYDLSSFDSQHVLFSDSYYLYFIDKKAN